jgi:pimeloyl-ACP methyl ester carboxylesterase
MVRAFGCEPNQFDSKVAVQGRRQVVIASSLWRRSSDAEFRRSIARRGMADLRHYSVEFCEWGSGPPVILLPGLAGGYELLASFADALSSHFHVISPQLRGETDCFALRRRFGLRDLVEDVREFIEWMGLERPIVCGVSFGGLLALEFGATFPHLPSAIAVQGVGARYERGLMQRIASIVLSGYPLPPNSPFVNQFFNLLFGGQQPRDLFDFVTHQCWQTDQSVMAHRLRLIERRDLAARVSRIVAPTYVMAGDRDLLVSSQSLERLYSALNNGRAETLDGCGHLAFATHPELVAAKFQAFLTTAMADCHSGSMGR